MDCFLEFRSEDSFISTTELINQAHILDGKTFFETTDTVILGPNHKALEPNVLFEQSDGDPTVR